VVDSRGNHITIAAPATAATPGDACWRRCMRRRSRATTWAGRRRGCDPRRDRQGSLFEFDPKAAKTAFETINLRKRPVRARTARRIPTSAR